MKILQLKSIPGTEIAPTMTQVAADKTSTKARHVDMQLTQVPIATQQINKTVGYDLYYVSREHAIHKRDRRPKCVSSTNILCSNT